MVINFKEYAWEHRTDTIYVRIQDIRRAVPHPNLQTVEPAV